MIMMNLGQNGILVLDILLKGALILLVAGAIGLGLRSGRSLSA